MVALHAGEITAAVGSVVMGGEPWFGTGAGGRMPEDGREYLAFYRPESPDAGPGTAPARGGP
jgi:hypothetical protein